MDKKKRLIYAEDVLERLNRERLIIGQHAMNHCISAVNHAPSVSPLEALGVGCCEECQFVYPSAHSDYICTKWGSDCNADEFCKRFERR